MLPPHVAAGRSQADGWEDPVREPRGRILTRVHPPKRIPLQEDPITNPTQNRNPTPMIKAMSIEGFSGKWFRVSAGVTHSAAGPADAEHDTDDDDESDQHGSSFDMRIRGPQRAVGYRLLNGTTPCCSILKGRT